MDFGGCRCQAFLLTGDAGRTDPVCHLSPDHEIVADAVQAANEVARPREAVFTPRPIHGTRCARCRGRLGQLPGSRKGSQTNKALA